MVSYSQGFDLAIPSVRKDSLCSFSAVENFIHAKVVNATKLTPEMASIPVNCIQFENVMFVSFFSCI